MPVALSLQAACVSWAVVPVVSAWHRGAGMPECNALPREMILESNPMQS